MRSRRRAMSWADSEFEDAWVGDDRRRQRAIRVCERLAEHPSESIPVACCGRAEVEAAYRFFSNDKVTAARVQGNRVKPIKSFLRTAITLWVMSARRSVLLSESRLKNRST